MVWVAIALGLCSAQAHAQAQFLVGVRAGVGLPTSADLPVGPSAGIDASVRMSRAIAAELTLDQSAHRVEAAGTGQTVTSWMSAWTAGVQYRLAVDPFVPYASLGIEGRRVSKPRAGTETGYGASFAVGALVPLGDHWYWGPEARWGIGNDGAFPTRQTYILRFGWRNIAF